MQENSYGMNQTVINTVFPNIVRDISSANSVRFVDVWAAMGGVGDWSSRFPESCSPQVMDQWPPCKYYCDGDNCDQCHPGDGGYEYMAQWVKDHVFGSYQVV